MYEFGGGGGFVGGARYSGADVERLDDKGINLILEVLLVAVEVMCGGDRGGDCGVSVGGGGGDGGGR